MNPHDRTLLKLVLVWLVCANVIVWSLVWLVVRLILQLPA